jgi:hypothetical protein
MNIDPVDLVIEILLKTSNFLFPGPHVDSQSSDRCRTVARPDPLFERFLPPGMRPPSSIITPYTGSLPAIYKSAQLWLPGYGGWLAASSGSLYGGYALAFCFPLHTRVDCDRWIQHHVMLWTIC